MWSYFDVIDITGSQVLATRDPTCDLDPIHKVPNPYDTSLCGGASYMRYFSGMSYQGKASTEDPRHAGEILLRLHELEVPFATNSFLGK